MMEFYILLYVYYRVMFSLIYFYCVYCRCSVRIYIFSTSYFDLKLEGDFLIFLINACLLRVGIHTYSTRYINYQSTIIYLAYTLTIRKEEPILS